MAWKYQRGGVWWIGYRLNGKQKLRSTRSKDEAAADREVAKLDQISMAHGAGNLTEEFYRLITNSNQNTETLHGIRKQWLLECKDLSDRTIEKYRGTLEEFYLHVNATETKPLMREIRPETIGAFIRQKRAATSTATAGLCRKVLSSFFSYAVDNHVLQVNPVPRAKSLKLTKESEQVRRAFTIPELKTLYKKCPNDFWRWMVLAGFYCGQRMGDLVTMTWGAVDFVEGTIRLRARKTGASVTVPLRPVLAAFLGKLCDKAGQIKPSDPIWPEQCDRYEKNGAALFSNEFYDTVLLPAGLVTKRSKHARKLAPGEVRTITRKVNPISFHCLRHSFVTLLKVTGGSQAVAKELAGHSSDAVSDLYTHVPIEALTKAIGKLPEVTK